ncbi:class I adenylate-forming enzyme family protein [Arthrobacter sp. S41]|uniref:class I adenylate-forming enzyme family protein n=1 Tax=Arthrobacter sp. S41 TaxID=2509721 RepID=UPI0010368C64|nr:class I adenylate-forming enzyme family protein [Arthrobacter sp. S41]TAP27493.1 long-chain fatty acid--CoA ligase [Arthrobacter sp. S41]
MDYWTALNHWSQQRPDHLAVASTVGQLTYSQLADYAQQLATTLDAVPNQRIGILTSDPVQMAVGFQGTALAGKTLVVLDPAWPEALLRSMINLLQCTHLISQDLPECLDADTFKLVPLPQSGSTGPRITRANSPKRELLIICTSGTTSRPKAIVRTAESWTTSIASCADILGATSDSITLSPGPISHGLGLYSLVESLHTGGTFVGTGRWNVDGTRTLLKRFRCNRIVSVPTILELMLNSIDANLLGHVTCVVSGGESLRPVVVNQLHSLVSLRHCVEYFGSSEHSLIAYAKRIPGGVASNNFVGTLFPEVEVHLHDKDLHTGTGRVFVQSPFNAIDYLAETAPPMARCHTSTSICDMAKVSGNREITFLRRGDGMLNLHGNNIYVQEIEQAFVRVGLPQIKIQVQGSDGNERLVAFVCSTPVEGQDLLSELGEFLPTYKIPHEVIFMSRWPQTFSGKATLLHLDEGSEEFLQRLRLR